MPKWVEIAVQLTPAFMAFVVGASASIISYLNYRTTKDKFRLDLYEKRLECFDKLHDFFADIVREGTVRETALPILSEARRKSLFMFGPEVEQFLDEAWKKAAEVNMLHTRLYGPGSLPVGPERNKVCDQESTLVKWYYEKMKSSYELYSPYLRFER